MIEIIMGDFCLDDDREYKANVPNDLVAHRFEEMGRLL